MTANTERLVGAEHSNVDLNPHDLVNPNRSMVQVPLPAFTEQETRQREGTHFLRAVGRYVAVPGRNPSLSAWGSMAPATFSPADSGGLYLERETCDMLI